MKNYSNMTTAEQAQWIKEFTQLSCVIPKNDTNKLYRLFELLTAWPFAQKFCTDALRYGDFPSRVYRLPVYITKVREQIGNGIVKTDVAGKPVAVVVNGGVARRRGRPTREEVAARQRGEQPQTAPAATPETAKRTAIAKLLGLKVETTAPARELNNAELAEEKRKKQEEAARMQPSLFDGMEVEEKPAPTVVPGCVSMAEVYQDRINDDRLHLSDIAWLCSKELQERISLIREQRTTFGDAAQAAKVLAEHNGNPDEIAAYAKKAEAAQKAYEGTYAAVDEELAVLFARLQKDEPFVKRFCKRYHGVDIDKICHITRPYYEKLRGPELAIRVDALIAQDTPEYAEQLKAEAAKKKEVTALLRYLKRKDKPNVLQRIKTMKERYARLIELLGEEEASVYKPILTAAIEDYEAHYADKKKKKKTTKKGGNK